MADLGVCESGWCAQPAVVYVSGPTLGPSPRLLIIAGGRAAQLSESEVGILGVRCLDCACRAVEQLAEGSDR